MEYLTVDRFEGDFAVCENADRVMTNIPREKLPEEIREGDILCFDGETYYFDGEESEKRARRIADKMRGLWN